MDALGRRPWLGWAVGAGSFLVAFLARYHFSNAMAGLPFVTFFLAVLVTSFVGGWLPATVVAVASLVAAGYFFLPLPGATGSFAWPRDAVALGFFVLVAGSQIALMHRLTRALARLEWKRAQMEAMRAAEQLMFSELQHRVANGIQLVASLLSLAASRVETAEDAVAALDDAVTRLSVVATIHRRLHDPALGDAGFQKALEMLARDILSAAGRQGVTVSVHAPRLAITPADATTLSMIVAEAVTNAIKHAFGERETGRIDIRFEADQAGTRRLTVRDDGRGFAMLPDPQGDESLGMLVMSSMAQRMGGALELGNAPEGGALVMVVIPPHGQG